MKDETLLPVEIQMFRNREFKIIQIVSPRAKHPGALNVSVLLQFVFNIPREKHGEQVIERHSARNDVAADDYSERSSWVSRGAIFGGINFLVTVHHNGIISVAIGDDIFRDVVRVFGVSLICDFPNSFEIAGVIGILFILQRLEDFDNVFVINRVVCFFAARVNQN